MKNLNAAEIMEMRRQAEELLKQAEEQRTIAIQYHRQQLVELNAEDVQATIVNNITINKGKVVEITKEDNSTIEMLRETIRQMNQNMNDMIKQHEEEITKLKEQYEQQMLDMTSEFEYEVECIVNKREKQIKELEEKLDFKELLLKEFNENMDEKIKTIHALEDKIEELEDKMDGMKFGYENKIAKLKEEKTHFIYVDNDPTFDNEPEPEEEVVNEVEEIIVPTTKEEKSVSNAPYSINIKTTHDAVKAKITVKDKVFYAAWSVEYNKPAYALVDNHKQYTRKGLGQIGLGIAYKYDKQITADLESHRDKLLEELEAKSNKNNNRKPEPQVTKENTIEAPEEIEVPITNDTTNAQTNEESIETDDKWADIDNAEFF